MLTKRSVLFGTYDTADYGWTLTGCQLTAPEQKTNYVEKSGGDGSWDLSTVLSDGTPRYKDRTLTVDLACSEGTRQEREDIINHMVNLLDGFEWQIILPDHPNHYLTGRAHVAVNVSDWAHASVTITALCAPWFFRTADTVVSVGNIDGVFGGNVTLRNSGRRAIVPRITIVGEESVSLKYGTAATNLSAGSYEWPTLLLTPGNHEVTCSGYKTTVTFTYREAVLR